MREDLQFFDEVSSGFFAAFEFENNRCTESVFEQFFCDSVRRVAVESGIANPFNLVLMFEEFCGGQRVFAVTLHAQGERFDALQELPCVIGRKARAEVAKRHEPHAEDVGQRAEFVGQVDGVADAVVAFVRLGEQGMLAGCPVKLSGVNDDSADAVAVST